MNKKLIISLAVASVVIIAVIIGIFAIGSNTAQTTFEPKVNSIVSVPVVIKNNPGFFAGEFHISYDKELLEYVDCEEGKISMKIDPEYFSQTDNTVNFIVQNDKFEDNKENGILAYLNFKVLKKADDYKLKIGDNTMLGNFDGKEAKADISLGDMKAK